jgi:hypothetical protein
MSSQLTYILGAGASHESIPVVKTFNKRLFEFRNYLIQRSGQLRSDQYGVPFSSAVGHIEQLHKDFSS